MTDDPIHDFLQYDLHYQRWLSKRPRCHACEEPITEVTCLYDTNGNRYHKDSCVDGWIEAMKDEFTELTMKV